MAQCSRQQWKVIIPVIIIITSTSDGTEFKATIEGNNTSDNNDN